jgi:two-component system phosphate regulon response regulator PhoB
MVLRKILAVDDEEDILELVDYNLTKEGFRVIRVASGEKALELAKTERPDLIILDLMLPGVDGLEVCKHLRAERATSDIPIVMLTAKGEEADIVLGLELGADDYVTKPFSPRVLTARVRAVLRRRSKASADEDAPIRIGGIEIHPGRHEVLVGGKPLRLTFTEFEILSFLARRPGWVFTRYQIVEAVRGGEYAVTDRSVDVQIVGLRKKLGKSGINIETVRGVGYRFKEPIDEED